MNTSTLVIFPAGAGNGAVMCTRIPIIDDNLIEGVEYYLVKPLFLLRQGTVDLGDRQFIIDDNDSQPLYAIIFYLFKGVILLTRWSGRFASQSNKLS